MRPSVDFWKGRRVFITGHTGFKGSWMTLWLTRLGAFVTGYSLAPPTCPSLYEVAQVGDTLDSSVIGDVRDLYTLEDAMSRCLPQVVFHLAAQPLVRESYRKPAETFDANVMGTVNLLEAVRKRPDVQAVVIVTTDKVYANPGDTWHWPYREADPLGASDPYSTSKACCELVATSYAASYLSITSKRKVGLATVRSGNVLGGGDWSPERLLPDCIRAFQSGERVSLRYPTAVRPWQHVLDAIRGYILLAEKLASGDGRFDGAWNFSPPSDDAHSVEEVVSKVCLLWGAGATYACEPSEVTTLKETSYLTLDHSKATAVLGWRPLWSTEHALERTVRWYKRFLNDRTLASNLCYEQIEEQEKAL